MKVKIIKCRLEWIYPESHLKGPSGVKLVDDPAGKYSRLEYHYTWIEKILIKFGWVIPLPNDSKYISL